MSTAAASKKKIMIVDDDREFLQELQETLQLNDYDVTAVEDATEAMDAALRVRPDLILLDLKMPLESGFQVACKLKYFSQLNNIPIIAMTGHFKDSYPPLLQTYRINGCIRKPFDTVEVVSKIENAF